MKLIVYESESHDGYARERLNVDGVDWASVYPLCECPEDAIIGRSLVSCGEIVGFMQKAYEAGLRGQPFTVKWAKEE